MKGKLIPGTGSVGPRDVAAHVTGHRVGKAGCTCAGAWGAEGGDQTEKGLNYVSMYVFDQFIFFTNLNIL